MNEELLAAHELILDAITPGPWAIEPGGAAPASDPDTTCIRVVAGEPNAISGHSLEGGLHRRCAAPVRRRGPERTERDVSSPARPPRCPP